MRKVSAGMFGLVLTGMASPGLHAQSAVTLSAYSYTELNSLIAPNMTVKVYRDGPKELLVQTRPVSAAAPKGYRGGVLHDFQTHTEYVWDVTDRAPNCGKQALADSTAPATFDVITGAADMFGEIAKANAKLVG